MTIDQHISAIRGLLNNYTERETPLSREFIYHHLRVVAAMLIKQKYDRTKIRNPFNNLYYCIPLEVGKVYDCPCINVGCDVMRSVDLLPAPIMGRSAPMIRLATLDHHDIGYIEPSIADSLGTDPVRKGKLHYSIVGGRLIIWNSNPRTKTPKAVLIGGYYEDPTQWVDITACDNNGDPAGNCYNISQDDFPIDADLVSNMYDIVVRRLVQPLTIPEDAANQSLPV